MFYALNRIGDSLFLNILPGGAWWLKSYEGFKQEKEVGATIKSGNIEEKSTTNVGMVGIINWSFNLM